MQIAGRKIGPDHPPFIIAEASCNHNGYLGRALALVDAAKTAGADAIKFQAYTADTITIRSTRYEFLVSGGLWDGQRMHELYKKTETPFEWFPHIAARAKEMDIIWFASVFDKTSVDMLTELGVPAFKIASFELVDLPLIRYAASKGKPMIMSTGMASGEEIADAVMAVPETVPVAMLHCVSGYPTPPGEANLTQMAKLRWFGNAYGLSDHTSGIEIPIAATALGASIIEKHLTLPFGRTEDEKFSLDPFEFKAMARGVRTAWAAMSNAPTDSETSQRPLRRSLYVVADVKAGEIFSEANVRSIRPGAGLPPKELDNVLGKTAACDIAYGTPLAWDLVSQRTRN